MPLAVDYDEYLIKLPVPLASTPHLVHPLRPDVGRKHLTEPVPPVPHLLMADVDPALKEQVFNIPQRQRIPNINIITMRRITAGKE